MGARSPFSRFAIALLALAGLAACEQGMSSSPQPQARPAGLVPVAAQPVPPSAASIELARYYQKVQDDLLTRGLLRTDGGGPDTPYDATDLERNFETIAFFDEYTQASLTTRGRQSEGALARWSGPVRINAEFGPSVTAEQREKDARSIVDYGTRLARVTGHPISSVRRGGNFHVFVAGEDDTEFVQSRLKQLLPGIGPAQLDLFDDLPRSFYCFVFATTGGNSPYSYTSAVALIRAEHPDLVRLSCIHEEMAQGLGLPNDSPAARPSIFNDDDEFALLTSHDEKLLAMLYDPRLTPGMTAAEARPVVRILAREQMGQAL
ncbi:DUF2927 domain-containing protein [Lutimaribacter marinistellae]|uniref:DUF2927 domain-containing protein n=1 Tax=Lutimaribacter marinistellae TaxID=1820329 RepID=A0ABV7TIH7_9RHOB